MSGSDRKFPDGGQSRLTGFSEVPQSGFVGVESVSPLLIGPAAVPRDGYEGFVPNIPATPTFTAEEAKTREGNYVLSLGLGGSGKSTFHSFLLRYIEQSGTLEHEMSIPRLRSGEPDHQTRNLLNQWRSTWNRGEFVGGTPSIEAAIREIGYEVVPTSGVKARLKFGLVEVAGELLRQVQGGRTGKQSLPEAVHHLIANPRVNLIVLMLIHPDTPNNDILLTNFIDYLDQNFPGRRQQISLGIVIANPDRALEQMIRQTGGREASPFAHYQRLEDDAVFDYMKVMSPGILSKWSAWSEKNRMITPLRLGDIQIVEDNEGNRVQRLVATDYGDISKIFDWLYRKFTGKSRGPTLIQRFFTDMNKPV